ncbi:MAG: hypothetical protein AAF891_00245 [Pseudomonadota bacterium]
MIELSHSVSGGQIGTELANDEEELGYTLVAIAEAGIDDTAIADFLTTNQRREVCDLCNSIALSLADD